CFFFRAEDGIRDRNVTGVQTCALPISALPVRDIANFSWVSETLAPATRAPVESCTVTRSEPPGFWALNAGGKDTRTAAPKNEMARAICFRTSLRMDPDLASPESVGSQEHHNYERLP